MKILLVAVLDAAVGSYGNPFFVRTKGEATRLMLNEVGNKDSQLARHPADFSLFLIGEFDQNLGVLIPRDAPEKIVDIVSLIAKSDAVHLA